MNEPTHLDLFSGIGGFALAAQWAGFRTIDFCEIDKYCQKVLAKNFGAIPDPERDGQHGAEKRRGTYWRDVNRRVQQLEGFCDAPALIYEGEAAGRAEQSSEVVADAISKSDEGIQSNGSGKTGVDLERDSLSQTRREQSADRPCRIHPNIFDLDGTAYRGVSLITGGFPCQPFSVAGKRRGAADDRAIWPQMFRVINEARPAWILGENVPGIIPMELDNVLSDLEGIGYATRPFVIPACAVDARHRRDRLWIVGRLVADVPWIQQGREIERPERERAGAGGKSRNVADAEREKLQRQRFAIGLQPERSPAGCGCRWLPEPAVGRVAHGISSRVDRLKGLGNAIVPQVAYEILREIRKLI